MYVRLSADMKTVTPGTKQNKARQRRTTTNNDCRTAPKRKAKQQKANQGKAKESKAKHRTKRQTSDKKMGVFDSARKAMGISTGEPEPEPEPDPLEEFGDMCPKLTVQQVC